MADVKFPGIPAISTTVPREVSSVLAPMREILQAISAGNLPQSVFLRGLHGVGLVDNAGRPSIPPGAIQVDTTPPPAPTGLEAGGAIANVILSWDEVPPEIRPRIAYAEIWRAETNDISVAQIVGQSTANVYVDAIGAAATRYYWIRYVSPAAITGPFNGQVGTKGATSTDPNVLIDLLVGAGNSGVFYKNEDPNLVINGVPVPVGVYMRDTFIGNGTISNAKIGNGAIDNAKIANLDAGKITTGQLSADRIDVNAIKAAIGTFTEANIGNASIGWAKLYGDMYSDNWFPSGGAAGWYLARNGNIYAQNGYFKGEVNATSGSFTGSINATSGNFTGNVNAASFNGQVIGTGNFVVNAVSEGSAAGGSTTASVTIMSSGKRTIIFGRSVSSTSGETSATTAVQIARGGTILSVDSFGGSVISGQGSMCTGTSFIVDYPPGSPESPVPVTYTVSGGTDISYIFVEQMKA